MALINPVLLHFALSFGSHFIKFGLSASMLRPFQYSHVTHCFALCEILLLIGIVVYLLNMLFSAVCAEFCFSRIFNSAIRTIPFYGI